MVRVINFFNKWFDGRSVWEVLKFFIRGLLKGDINARASAFAFDFFLALFPSIIFLFTLIPFIPIDNFQFELLQLIQSFIPKQAYASVRDTIEDIINNKHEGVLSAGFLLTMYFATNGTSSMINSFNRSYHGSVKIAAWRQKLIAVFITILISVFIITAIALLVGETFVIKYIYKHYPVNKKLYVLLVDSGKWIIIISLCFFAVNSLYYFGASRTRKFQFISAGGTLATILIILTSFLFNYFVSHFINYNKVYGSIGTLILMMVYIRFNALQLLLGYELNASIDNARERARRRLGTPPS